MDSALDLHLLSEGSLQFALAGLARKTEGSGPGELVIVAGEPLLRCVVRATLRTKRSFRPVDQVGATGAPTFPREGLALFAYDLRRFGVSQSESA